MTAVGVAVAAAAAALVLGRFLIPASERLSERKHRWRDLLLRTHDGTTWPGPMLVAAAVIMGASGRFVPAAVTLLLPWAAGRVSARVVKERLRRSAEDEAPDVLDLAACLAAGGLSPREALAQAAASGSGALSRAVRQAVERAQLGADFLAELDAACLRLQAQEGAALARALVAAEALGAPVADVLRAEADRSRERQRLRRIQQADALPFKLTVVMALFFLPAILAVVLVPSALNFLARW